MKITTLALLVAAAAQAQTIAVTEAGKTDLPAPMWRNQNAGRSTAELRITSDAAAAMRLSFAWLNLPEGAEMYLYGKDASGRVVAAHGPYTGHGPLNLPDFDSQILSGTEVTVLVHAPATAEWPFAFHGVEQFAAADVADFKLEANYRPAAPRTPSTDIRSAYVGDTLVQFTVENGMAIMEGDIVLGPVDEVVGGGRKSNGERASFAANPSILRWPNAQIPFTIQYDANIMVGGPIDVTIQQAIAYWNSRFPGTLVARTSQADYMVFTFAAGICRSPIGRKGGRQIIEVGAGCSRGNLVHEIAHTLGFYHEHTRFDRDQFVQINWSNIPANRLINFQKPAADVATNIGAYDFGSIMHYPANAFAIDTTVNTVTPLVTLPTGVVMGQRNALSAGDEAGMRTRYCNAMYFFAPGVVEIDNDGGGGAYTVSMPSYCTWQIVENLSWIVVTSAKTGTGTTNVTFTATKNNTSLPRNGAIRLNGRTTTIRQIPDTWQQ